LKSLEDIDHAFQGNLYEALNAHFTREYLSQGIGQ